MKNILLLWMLLIKAFLSPLLCFSALHTHPRGVDRIATVQQYDVVIDEVMADPTPQVGLPNVEWIELKNSSLSPINLSGWRFAKAASQSGLFPVYTLKPDSFVIVCTSSAVASLAVFGPTISVTSFPALDNAGDLIYLLSNDNRVIHTVNYSDTWYKDELKKNGGWSLEMIDTKNPCSGSNNWKASIDAHGGTPGKQNSVNGINADVTIPVLLHAYASDSLTITLVFNEPLDSLKASIVSRYNISDGIGTPINAVVIAPKFDRVLLRLPVPLLRQKVYTATASSVTDCAGNVIGAKNIARLALAYIADSLDIVVNEILFNPRPAGVDYVELYNRSQKTINARQLYLANRNTSNAVSSITQLSADSLLIFPGDFVLMTTDPQIVMQQYITLNPDAFLTMASMPSYSNTKGNVIVLDGQGKIMDEVSYSDSWHFQLITNTEGVSLERIDYNAPSVAENFHSAATSAGYGTPGYKNSQYRPDGQLTGEVGISPEVFSPDNDGIDDVMDVQYTFPTPGYVANITIYDANGRPVRYLEKNALCGIKGVYRWDGLGEKMQQLPVGIYIIVTEAFNANGKTKQFKNTVVLARKL